AQDFTVVGIVKVGDADNLGGATIAAFDMATAHEVLDRPRTFDAIDVRSAVESQDEVRQRIDDALGRRYDVVTGEQLAAQEAEEVIDSFVNFLGTALLIFAGVALFVGTFIISNTFSIIVASRTRELALLRTLGARRRQVMASVLGEAFLTGVVSSLAGVGFGILVASGLKAVFAAFGGNLPSSANVVTSDTIAVALTVGVVVTLLAALLPAFRATRVAPIAALREEGMPVAGDVPRLRVVVGATFGLLGLVLLGVGLNGGKATTVGLGAAAFMLGVAVFSVVLARPLARLIGLPIARTFGLPGRLAQENAMRNPSRSSSTAAALMIGLALVTFVSVLAASLQASLSQALDRLFAADYIVIGKSFEGFSVELGDELEAIPELADVVTLSGGQARAGGETRDFGSTQLATFGKLIRLNVVAGQTPPDDGRGLMVDQETAAANGWRVGDEVPLEFAKTGVQPVRLAALFERNELTPNFLLSAVDYADNFKARRAFAAVAKARTDVPPQQSRAALERVVDRYPNAEVRDQVQYKESVTSRVNQLLALISVLLLLAILIAVIGIINTLALSVIERTRELGLLRALGMSRRQIRRMVRWESVIIAVIGAALGLAVGIFFGWALVRTLHDDGITVLSVPAARLAAYVVLAGLFGVVAAILPARRAARLNVLAAIAYE
ncbi:MAG: FtsX-like permease family protein, partial [Actinomycetota bacterium]|nr:FtsX-like permease family protein [Actinomycetota bacterium]